MSKTDYSDVTLTTGKLFGVYRGVVEQNNDPLKAGRVRVRIYGIHSASKLQKEGKDGIPTEHLPWAEPAGPIFGGNSKTGIFGVPNNGAHVFLFFENAEITQPRYFATALGIPYSGKKQPKGVGFGDPDEVYPTDKTLFEPDYSVGDQLTDPTKLMYIGSQAGHQIVLDSTDGNENIVIKHGKHGTTISINSRGDVVIHTEKDLYESGANKNVTIEENYSTTVLNDYSIKSKDSKETVTGNKDTNVMGTQSETIQQTLTVSTKKTEFNASDEIIIGAGGKITVAAGDECLVKSSDKDIVLYAQMMNIKMKALMKISSQSLQLDMKALTTADFGGLLTTVGGTTSVMTMVTGQIVMIG